MPHPLPLLQMVVVVQKMLTLCWRNIIVAKKMKPVKTRGEDVIEAVKWHGHDLSCCIVRGLRRNCVVNCFLVAWKMIVPFLFVCVLALRVKGRWWWRSTLERLLWVGLCGLWW
jgi:hypothetical protein